MTDQFTYGRVATLQQRLCRCQQELYVVIQLFTVGCHDGARKHCPCVSEEEVEDVYLTPFVHVNEDLAQPPILLVNEIEPRRTHGLECDDDTADGEWRPIIEKGLNDRDEGWEVRCIEPGACVSVDPGINTTLLTGSISGWLAPHPCGRTGSCLLHTS